MRLLSAFVLLVFSLAFAGLGSAQERLRVVASFSILADMVREVGGDAIDVQTLVGPGGDAHVFEPSPASAQTLGSASVLVVNGLGFEPWLGRLTDVSGFKGRTIVASEGVATISYESHGAVQADPHVWQSLANAVAYVNNIAAGLAAADPANADTYKARAAAYVAKLQALDGALKDELGRLPQDRRGVLVSHNSFGYFGAAYGLRFAAPAGLSTEAEPSAADVAQTIRQAQQQDTKAVFTVAGANPRLMEQVAAEIGVSVGGQLWSDTLSAPDGEAPTYLKMMELNAQRLKVALSE